MKKIIAICILGLLLISSFGLITAPIYAEKTEEGERDVTHTALGEYATASWCGPCKFAHGALKELYAEGNLDFYYVSLVCDKNTVANARKNEYNLYGYPTLWWDGGDEVDVGAGSIPGAKTAYTSSINTCSARTVEDVDITLSATWFGDTGIDIDCTVTNNEASDYGGTIRVFITEIESTEGWYDSGGKIYTFAFLDWAFNEDITITSGGSWSDSVIWDGSDYGYDEIYADNTVLIAAVFNDEWHQGYSYPPSGYPFDAYYVDETVGMRVGSNRAPYIPNNPDPSNGETDVALDETLSWNGGDPDWFDTVYYDVYFEKDDSTPDVLVSDGQEETSYDPGTLDLNSNYYWQIIAEDENGAVKSSPVWSFTTRDNNPPNLPGSPNPQNGATDVSVNANLQWTGGDPDGDPVTYDIYFGTSTPPPLVLSGQTTEYYDPGTLDFLTTYYWQIESEDSFGETATGPIWSFTTRGNDPPYTPSNPDPADGSTDVIRHPILSWDGDDPDGDDVFYDVYFGTSSSPPLVSSGQEETIYDPGILDYEETYYWKIFAEDEYGETSNGPIWSFTVMAEPQTFPDLECSGSLTWTNVKPGATKTGSFMVENVGDPTSELFWEIESFPEWGTWTFTPDHGSGLTPEAGAFEVEVSVIAPNTPNTQFVGEVIVKNIDDPSDTDSIPVTLTTPKARNKYLNFLDLLSERYPFLNLLIEKLIDMLVK